MGFVSPLIVTYNAKIQTLEMDHEISCKSYLLLDWLEVLQKKNEEQIRAIRENNYSYIPYTGIPTDVVNIVFHLAKKFNLRNEAKYLALHVFDKLIYRIFYRMIQESSHNPIQLLREDNGTVTKYAKIHLISCIQIAVKVDTHETELSIATILKMLSMVDPYKIYTKHSIIASERKVLHLLNWSIPLDIPLNYVEILLVFCGLFSIPGIEDACNFILDGVYLMREEIYNFLQESAIYNNGKMDLKTRFIIESNSLFLAAAIVLCSAFFAGLSRSDSQSLLSRLSEITRILDEEIWNFAKLLYKMVLK